ncbi:signal peptidase II [Halomonas borealis]|uniref:signal peptidase II n=1 Tax=Halomonas borealis TaxID=2508710 RepID=UPI0010A0A1C7|nr:signal peptidase II [Halomonas borealis]NUJ59330.1 lipoprotein signal peptidase [Halomonas taeanensis]
MRTKRIAMAPQSRYWLALAVMVGLADQVIKGLVQALMPYGQTIPLTPFFNWGHWWNTGAALSFLADSGGWQRYLFLCFAGLATIVLTFLLCRPRPRLEALGYSLMLGGALGNGIDRLVRGYVVDYLDIYWREWHWPAFNLADIALFLGVIAFAIAALRERPSPRLSE